MKTPPTRLMDDPAAPGVLRDDLSLAQRTRGSGYDADAGLKRLHAAIAIGVGVGTAAGTATGAATGAAGGGKALLGTLALWGTVAVGAAGLTTGVVMLSADPPATESAGSLHAPQKKASLQKVTPPEVEAIEMAPPAVEAIQDDRHRATGNNTGSARARPALVGARAMGERHTTATSHAIPARPESSPARTAPPANPDVALQDEIAQLATARHRLKADPQGALRLLQLGQSTFAGGIFGEERAALIVIAQSQLGHTDQARRGAQSFLQQYPHSSFADRVRQALKTESSADR